MKKKIRFGKQVKGLGMINTRSKTRPVVTRVYDHFTDTVQNVVEVNTKF